MTETIRSILAAHQAGRSPVDTITATYARIAAHNDPALFITLRPQQEAIALAQALLRQGGDGKPLYGVPIAVKDNIDVAGLPTTAACPDFTYHPQHSAFVVARLEAAGAIVIGKTNLDQFATGLVGVRSPYGIPRNALRADLIPGGSSSGSATAVGAGLLPFALGTDTAGSGRVPAALNGIVGLKPTLGLLSASGMVPACRTLDTISVFALTVEDAHLACGIAAGFDAEDAYSRPIPLADLSGFPPGLRIGVPDAGSRRFFGDTAAEAAYLADLERLRALGATLVEFDLAPFQAVASLLYDGPWVAERYAATRALIETRPEAIFPLTRGIIESARQFSAADGFDGAYKLAGLRRTTAAIRRGFDVMAVPTMPRIVTLTDIAAEPLRINRDLGTYTNFVNLLDLAALAIPSGRRGDGLPSSLTLIGDAGSDGLLAGIGSAIHAAAGVSIGATGLMPPPAPIAAIRAGAGRIELAVVGAHLSGLPLNHELTSAGAAFLRTAETLPQYRLFALPGTTPPKPGLLRVGETEGKSIATEIWSLDPAAFGAFVARIPAPLGIGTLGFSDGTSAKGFLVEAEAVQGARDISEFGGWRGFLAAQTNTSRPNP